tara:strand:+ start:214 stop:342 length:129 start_codon:yes stop_codon:yes gene_type:complete
MIIDKIPEFDDNQLLNLYRNAIRYLDHAEKREGGRRNIRGYF